MARTHDAQPSSADGAAPAKGELDFIVIGAQKAGTPTLFEHLRRHPDVSLPAGKESAFFSQDENFRRGWDAYLEGLAREGGMSGADRRWGTISPSLPTKTRRRLWGPYAHAAARARALNRRAPAARQTDVPPRPETIDRLREHYAADAERLAGMLGGHAPYWVSRPEAVAERT